MSSNLSLQLASFLSINTIDGGDYPTDPVDTSLFSSGYAELKLIGGNANPNSVFEVVLETSPDGAVWNPAIDNGGLPVQTSFVMPPIKSNPTGLYRGLFSLQRYVRARVILTAAPPNPSEMIITFSAHIQARN